MNGWNGAGHLNGGKIILHRFCFEESGGAICNGGVAP